VRVCLQLEKINLEAFLETDKKVASTTGAAQTSTTSASSSNQ